MKVIYKRGILERLDDRISEAKKNDRTISHIELNLTEWKEYQKAIVETGRAKPHAMDYNAYCGIEIWGKSSYIPGLFKCHIESR